MNRPTRRRLQLLAAALGVLVALHDAARADGRPPLTRIAFGSCADEEKPQPIWKAILAYQPELFLFTGDNVYGDVRDGKRVPEADRSRGLRLRPRPSQDLATLRATVPTSRPGTTTTTARTTPAWIFAGKAQAKSCSSSSGTSPPGDPGPAARASTTPRPSGPRASGVQVILLDTRYFRSPLSPTDQRGAPGKERYLPDDDPGKTMLGDAQWAWLAERLREPADLRMIVSSIQVLADGHGWERWGNLPRERARLYELIGETGAEGVVFVSGDRHIGGIYRETDGDALPLHEMTSSGDQPVLRGGERGGAELPRRGLLGRRTSGRWTSTGGPARCGSRSGRCR